MPHHETIALSGVIQHVFAHRFTLRVGHDTHLADLSPKGAELFPLRAGLTVKLEGEKRPSEIKVVRISADGRDPVIIEHKKPHHSPSDARPDAYVAPEVIAAAVARSGWKVRGAPRRKPKHFEVMARRDDTSWMELHVDLSGAIYKQKPADAKKWEGVA